MSRTIKVTWNCSGMPRRTLLRNWKSTRIPSWLMVAWTWQLSEYASHISHEQFFFSWKFFNWFFCIRNVVEFTNYAFQANANYSYIGELFNGTVKGGFEIIMPQGPRIGFQLNRTRSISNALTNYNANLKGHYYRANSNVPISMEYTFMGRDIDLSRMMFDAVSELTVNTTKTKNLRIGLAAKNKMIKNIWSIGGKVTKRILDIEIKISCEEYQLQVIFRSIASSGRIYYQE